MTIQDIPFAIPPGQGILDELEANEIAFEDFAKERSGDFADREKVLSGEAAITPEIAEKLQKILGIKARMWLKMESDYREALATGKPVLDERRPQRSSGKLVLRLPVSLHERASSAAKSEHISLNQLLLSYVAEGVARTEALRKSE